MTDFIRKKAAVAVRHSAHAAAAFFRFDWSLQVEFFYVVQAGGQACEEGVGEDQGSHGFDDDYGSGNDDRVVAAVNLQLDRRAVFGDSVLRLGDGGRGFYVSSEYDLASVTDAAHDASGMVGGFYDGAGFFPESKSIIVLGTGQS